MEFNATLLVSAISFIIFVFLMNKLLYKPVLGIMEQRENYISKNKEDAQEHKKHALKLVEDKNKKISGAHKKSRDIVAAKTDSLKKEKSDIINNRKAELSRFVEEQKEDLAKQKDCAYLDLKSSVADIANNITTMLVGKGVAFEPLSDKKVDEVIRKNA